jgi:hypothetical protein
MLFIFIVLTLFTAVLLGWYIHKVSHDISQIDWEWDDDEYL